MIFNESAEIGANLPSPEVALSEVAKKGGEMGNLATEMQDLELDVMITTPQGDYTANAFTKRETFAQMAVKQSGNNAATVELSEDGKSLGTTRIHY